MHINETSDIHLYVVLLCYQYLRLDTPYTLRSFMNHRHGDNRKDL